MKSIFATCCEALLRKRVISGCGGAVSAFQESTPHVSINISHWITALTPPFGTLVQLTLLCKKNPMDEDFQDAKQKKDN